MRNKKKRPAAENTQQECQISSTTQICKFHQLPKRVIMDIISRLPIKALLSCRCVCKYWVSVISDRQFVVLHFQRSPISVLIKTMPFSRESRQFQLAQPLFDGHQARFQGGTKMKFSGKKNLPEGEFRLVNSCHGLLCLAGPKEEDPLCVCNPILGEYVSVPVSSDGRRAGTFSGLGFCPVSGQYKLLQTFHAKGSGLGMEMVSGAGLGSGGGNYQEAKVYTLGTRTWRSIGYAPYRVVSMPFYSYLNGFLHWVPCVPNSAEFIYAFDFEGEEFGVVPPPPHFGDKEKEMTDYLRLGVLDGCLSLCLLDRRDKFDLWVMKEYGVQQSWTKLYTVENLVYPRQRSWDFYEPMMILKNGEVLMLYNDDGTVCYNPKSNRVRNYSLSRTRSPFHAIGYTPCFLSLEDVARGEKLERLQSTQLYEKLLAQSIQSCGDCGTPLYKITKYVSSDGVSSACEPFPGAIVHAPDPVGKRMQTACATCGGRSVIRFSG